MKRMHEMPFGAAVQADGAVRFGLWAPEQRAVVLELAGVGEFAMEPVEGGLSLIHI